MSVNIILLGNSAVGKTTFLQQYIKKTFRDIGISTVGVDSETVNVVIDNEKEVTTKIWDTAGQEKFQAVFNRIIRRQMELFLSTQWKFEKHMIKFKIKLCIINYFL